MNEQPKHAQRPEGEEPRRDEDPSPAQPVANATAEPPLASSEEPEAALAASQAHPEAKANHGHPEPPASQAHDAAASATSDARASSAVDAPGATPPSVPIEEPSTTPAEPALSALEQKTAADEQDAAVLDESRRHTRRSFVVGAAASVAGYMAYEWMEKRHSDGMLPSPYRRALETNAALSRGLFQEHALSPTYPLSRAETLRVNGLYGLKQMLDPQSYRLQLTGMRDASQHRRFVPDVTAWAYRYVQAKSSEDKGHDTKTPPPAAESGSANTAEKMAPAPMMKQDKQQEAHAGRMPRGREEAGKSGSTLPTGTPGLLLTMDDILKLPRHELVTQFKCIEGWSQVVRWAGVRMADFLEAYPPARVDGAEPRYVYMETPDGDYYVGYDMEVCRHPQTLLVTEMMGAPLTQFHGAPLRIHMPTKYGYKQIKRIGLICYTNTKPDDYWTKLGYDWYAGL